MVPASSWTMNEVGARRVEISGVGDKRQITPVFYGTLIGDFLPLQIIYKCKSTRCHPHFQFPSGWHVSHSPKHNGSVYQCTHSSICREPERSFG